MDGNLPSRCRSCISCRHCRSRASAQAFRRHRMRRDRPIAIAGGGLAGLGVAHALAAFGFRAEVFEAASALGEIGAAVNTSPNATKTLQAIGLGDKVAAVANLSPGIFTRNMQTGEAIEYNNRLSQPNRYGAPHYTFHRADLLTVLAESLDPATIHLGHRLAGIEERGDAVRLLFEHGAVAD